MTCILDYIERPDRLKFEAVKDLSVKESQVSAIMQRLNERAKHDKKAKTYNSKQLTLKKGSYPSEAALMNGLIFAVLNADELYQNTASQCLVILMPDHHDSDELLVLLVLEKTDQPFAAFVDIQKKSEIQVRFTEAEILARSDYTFKLSDRKAQHTRRLALNQDD